MGADFDVLPRILPPFQIKISKLENVRALIEKTVPFYFPSRNFFERKIFISVVGVFFLFFILPMRFRFSCRGESLMFCILHTWAGTAVRRPEVVVRKPIFGQFFLHIIGCSLTHFYFVNSKKQCFFPKIYDLIDTWFFFSKMSVSDVTETTRFPSLSLKKLDKGYEIVRRFNCRCKWLNYLYSLCSSFHRSLSFFGVTNTKRNTKILQQKHIFLWSPLWGIAKKCN